ncbi:amino acid permease-associated protein [Gordonia neofelifaecis NRRL B-59395]|uniref:Amino acid permease-associated protein n=2 Tax=Gordonia TaxID=2053 RepID=F1YJ22_9ACTN|nr:amino acid permease-associated protein [Gordonia neofelifaecis NRRL B-59395]
MDIPQASVPDQSDQPRVSLKRGMKSRHLFMITLAGVIGTGLFLGTGDVISQAGPGGTILAYLVGGVLLYLTMVCLGEMSAVMPVSGSFQAHATKFIGPGTGFTIGWVYWISWASFIGLEFLSAGIVMKYWFPDTPTWFWSAFFIVVLFAINCFTVRSFAETEYALAAVKVLAVGLFIGLGLLAVFGVVHMDGQPAPGLSNFTSHGGFFPVGLGAVFAAMMTVVYTFMGSEVMGVAAGETENPQKAIPRAVRTIVFRLVFLYLGAILILIALIPWDQLGLDQSPFVTVLDAIGIPYAAGIMNFVILVAILSVGNTGLYMCTRILWSLAQEHAAPKAFGRTTKRGIPLAALIFTLAFGLLSLLTSVVAADTLFVFLISVSGVGGALCWMTIAFSQYRFRKQYVANGGDLADLPYKAPMYPFTPIAVIVLNLAVFVAMAFDSTQRLSLLLGLACVPVCYAAYHWVIGPRAARALTGVEAP